MNIQLPPGLKNILIIMVLGAMAQTALPRIGIYPDQWYLYYPDSENFKIWQLITHIFVMEALVISCSTVSPCFHLEW